MYVHIYLMRKEAGFAKLYSVSQSVSRTRGSFGDNASSQQILAHTEVSLYIYKWIEQRKPSL